MREDGKQGDNGQRSEENLLPVYFRRGTFKWDTPEDNQREQAWSEFIEKWREGLRGAFRGLNDLFDAEGMQDGVAGRERTDYGAWYTEVTFMFYPGDGRKALKSGLIDYFKLLYCEKAEECSGIPWETLNFQFKVGREPLEEEVYIIDYKSDFHAYHQAFDEEDIQEVRVYDNSGNPRVKERFVPKEGWENVRLRKHALHEKKFRRMDLCWATRELELELLERFSGDGLQEIIIHGVLDESEARQDSYRVSLYYFQEDIGRAELSGLTYTIKECVYRGLEKLGKGEREEIRLIFEELPLEHMCFKRYEGGYRRYTLVAEGEGDKHPALYQQENPPARVREVYTPPAGIHAEEEDRQAMYRMEILREALYGGLEQLEVDVLDLFREMGLQEVILEGIWGDGKDCPNRYHGRLYYFAQDIEAAERSDLTGEVQQIIREGLEELGKGPVGDLEVSFSVEAIEDLRYRPAAARYGRYVLDPEGEVLAHPVLLLDNPIRVSGGGADRRVQDGQAAVDGDSPVLSPQDLMSTDEMRYLREDIQQAAQKFRQLRENAKSKSHFRADINDG
ncbi:hypothetical protein SAMN02745181_0551 [Rubritalea squalenifaciens DSM 18772]|uniref:Uncharacterized protein n=1 Tax=Rubritalea squalenifaciens DSM 18772 TaxID=1123071 RepID=A0A1M6CS20_9BACT|nr:hypothetical protein [Rubritalea squalenifaciens]SHI63786.1 hypothetical protein SAMN02745181_0551 [Rubritalea squalenifaciens DSM 18772]